MSVQELFTRHPANPILTVRDLSFPAKAVCNPAACRVGDETLLLLRVIDPDDHSSLVVARSSDGIGGWRFESPPLLSPGEGGCYETEGCEDPRVIYLPNRDEYVIAYVGSSSDGAGICLATSRDFRTAERLGLVIHPYNKDAALFPRQIGGRYQLLHRPTAGARENVWLSESEDLVHWGRPRCVLREEDKPGWDSGKVGAGPPPIETPDGWLLIFHGVEQQENGWLYRVGLALLDLDDPSKLVARLPNWVLEPLAEYEKSGDRPGIVFPTGTTVVGGRLNLYYGAADTSVCLATTEVGALLEALRETGC